MPATTSEDSQQVPFPFRKARRVDTPGLSTGSDEGRLSPSRFLVLLSWAVLCIAAGLRVWYFLALWGTEIFHPLGDALSYLGIARTVALEGHFPAGPLFQSAYWFPLMEASVLKLGLGLATIHALQYLAGFLSVATIIVAGPAVIGRLPSLLAGAILAVYGPALFHETQLVTTVWAGLFLVAGLLLPLGRIGRRGMRLLVAGIFLGLGVQSQANMILAVVAFFVPLTLARRRFGYSLRLLALLPLGLFVALLPPMAHNASTGNFTPLSTNGGINFFIGNGPGATGLFTLPPGYDLMNDEALFARSTLIYPARVLGGTPTPSQASRFWTQEALRTIADDPLRAVLLVGKKLRYLIGSWEPTNYFSYRFFSRHFAPIPWAGDFGLLLALALPGIILLARDAKAGPLLFAMAGYAVSVLIFFVTDRYRFPLVPLLALSAGVTLGRLPLLWQRPARGGSWVLAAAAAVILLLSRSPAGPNGIRREDAAAWERIGYLRYQNGARVGAKEAFDLALPLDPTNEQTLVNLGFLLDEEGLVGEARELYRRALDVNPGNGIAWLNLGQTYLKEGKGGSALMHFERGLAVAPYLSGLHAGRAEALMASGRFGEAKEALDDTQRAGIVSADLLNIRGILLLRTGDRAGAWESFRHSLRLDPSYGQAKENLRLLEQGPGIDDKGAK